MGGVGLLCDVGLFPEFVSRSIGSVITDLELEVPVREADVGRQAASSETLLHFFCGESDVRSVTDLFEKVLGVFESAEGANHSMNLAHENVENSRPERLESPTERLLEEGEHEFACCQFEVESELDGCGLATFENHGLFDCVVLPGLVRSESIVKKEFFPRSFHEPSPVSVSQQEDIVAAVCFGWAQILNRVCEGELPAVFNDVVYDREEVQVPLGFSFFDPILLKEIEPDDRKGCYQSKED